MQLTPTWSRRCAVSGAVSGRVFFQRAELKHSRVGACMMETALTGASGNPAQRCPATRLSPGFKAGDYGAGLEAGWARGKSLQLKPNYDFKGI